MSVGQWEGGTDRAGEARSSYPEDPRLAQWAEALDRVGWAICIIDSDFKLVWVSDDLKQIAGETDNDRLGYGKNIVEAFLGEAWASRIPPESLLRMFKEMSPYLLQDERTRTQVVERFPEPIKELVSDLEPQPLPYVYSTSFNWKVGDDLPEYRVDLVVSRIQDDEGDFMGAIFTAFMGVKASLVTLLALGDQSMYERMAKLVDPKRRQAAVLFCDLESSAVLSRQLPTIQYFKLVRQFSTCVDEVIGSHMGVSGKHAGDGASAFFLIDDLGSASGAARASIAAARELQERVHELDVPMSPEAGGCVLNIGLHWGGGLYMGQLVPGGRLDVTALGDEVNECARVQETARNGSLVASKSLIEQLTEEDAAALGIDSEKLSYMQLTEMPDASEKAKRDAGGLPVTTL